MQYFNRTGSLASPLVGERTIAIRVSVCLSVCLTVSARMSQKPHVQISPNWLGPPSTALQLCISGFVDDVICSHNNPANGRESKTKRTFRPVRQVAAPGTKSTVFDCILLQEAKFIKAINLKPIKTHKTLFWGLFPGISRYRNSNCRGLLYCTVYDNIYGNRKKTGCSRRRQTCHPTEGRRLSWRVRPVGRSEWLAGTCGDDVICRSCELQWARRYTVITSSWHLPLITYILATVPHPPTVTERRCPPFHFFPSLPFLSTDRWFR